MAQILTDENGSGLLSDTGEVLLYSDSLDLLPARVDGGAPAFLAMDGAGYLAALQDLLPTGTAWPRAASTALAKVLRAMADGLARLHARVLQLVTEADPRTTAEMLADWERAYGLPDPCLGVLPTTIQERRAALVTKITSTGGASIAYFEGLAATLGFPGITITEFKLPRSGYASCVDPLYGTAWAFAWQVNAPAVTVTYARSGLTACDEPLAAWGNELLECAFEKLKPAHTIVLFAYGGS